MPGHDSSASDAIEAVADMFIDNSIGNQNPDSIQETNEEHLWCPAPLMRAGAETLSASQVWHNLHEQILNASYHAHPKMETLNSTQLYAYKDWVNELYSFYTPSKLRRSIMNPSPPKQIVQLMKLAAEIKQHNAEVSDHDNENKHKLRILVLGGSVTTGVSCTWPDGINIPKPKHWTIPGLGCNWSSRLEILLNYVLFDGEEIVVVDNISTGGVGSEFGAQVLEYRLFPDPEHIPDVIVSAFSANESRYPDLDNVLYQHMQDFVKAAHSLRPCDDQAPLIMMVDDFYGGVELSTKVTRHTGNMFMLSTWNNIMAINYGSTVKYKVLSQIDKSDKTAQIPLIGNNYQIHLGVGMHVGLAWTIMFNIVNSIVNVCNDGDMGIENYPIVEGSALSKSAEIEKGREDQEFTDTDNLGDENNNSSASPPLKLDPDLKPYLEKEELAFKHIGRMQDSPNQYRDDWESNINATKEFCNKLDKAGGREKIPPKCSYAWFVNHLANFGHADQVHKKMSEVLLQNNGWAAEGRPIQQPRSGWYTHKPNSSFSVMLEDTAVDTNFVVILSMKSYSTKWIGSKLAVSTTVVKRQNDTTTAAAASNRDLFTNRTGAVDWDGDSDSIHLIDGYHDVTTSVHFSHKFPISGGGAKAGDSVIFDAKLVGGQEFKISGIAFCSF